MTAERVTRTVFFDTETGGVQPHHPTIQLAAVAINDADWSEASTFEVKIAFSECDADPEALKINHYDADLWQKEAVPPDKAAYLFNSWVRPHCTLPMVSKRNGARYSVAKLSGYNALTFDLPRLKELFAGAFFPCSYHVRDVLQRAMFWFDEHPDEPRPENLKLGTICSYFGIPVIDAHDALGDVRMTAALALALRKDVSA